MKRVDFRLYWMKGIRNSLKMEGMSKKTQQLSIIPGTDSCLQMRMYLSLAEMANCDPLYVSNLDVHFGTGLLGSVFAESDVTLLLKYSTMISVEIRQD